MASACPRTRCRETTETTADEASAAALALGALTLAVLAVSIPGSLGGARARGLLPFLRRFFEDIPKRLAGPGRMRFIIQPAVALFLGWRAGRSDAREGRLFLLEDSSRGTPERASPS